MVHKQQDKENAKAAPATTRREKLEAKEEAIVDVAYEIFLEKGYAKTTIAEIARASGVADGTVYLYFQNKEALARAVVANFYERLTQTAQKGVTKYRTTKAKLRFLAEHHMQNVMDQRRILEMLSFFNLDIESYGGSALFQLNKSYVEIFDEVIKTAIASGEVRDDLSTWVLRDIFYGAMDYGSRTMLIKSRRRDLNNFIDNLLQTILREEASLKTSAQTNEDIMQRLENVTARLEELEKVGKVTE